MNWEELRVLKSEAWQAFFDVFRENGIDDNQLKELRNSLNRKDCYNDVMDCLVEVLCDE